MATLGAGIDSYLRLRSERNGEKRRESVPRRIRDQLLIPKRLHAYMPRAFGGDLKILTLLKIFHDVEPNRGAVRCVFERRNATVRCGLCASRIVRCGSVRFEIARCVAGRFG